jgi:adenylate cyclase
VLAAIRGSLVAKLAVFMVGVVAAGFLVSAAGNARIEASAIEAMHRDSARGMATSLAAGVRNSMLTGNGVSVRDLLDDAKGGFSSADVHVYAPSGEEVFGKKPAPPPVDQQPAHVRAILGKGTAAVMQGRSAVPIENEERCHSCHEKGDLRGVLTLSTKGAKIPIDGSEASLDALAKIARAGFVQIMTAKREDKLDDYFEELAKKSPGLRGVAVYSTVAERKFGGDVGLEDAVVLKGCEKVPAFTQEKNGLRYRVVPLENEKRCQGCHSPKEDMRGALVVAFDPKTLDTQKTLVSTTDVSLRHVMLSGLGRMIVGFMDEVAHIDVVTELTVHDEEGRLYHDPFAKLTPPPNVSTVLGSGNAFESPDSPNKPEFVFTTPLKNDAKCQRCHGPDLPLRGAIEVRLDTSKEVAAIHRLQRQSLLFGIVTIILLVIVMGLFLRATVVKPVQKIGTVADQVGAGRFDGRISVSSNDEIGRLGTRINDMVAGLRQKIALSKFVSQATLETVERSSKEIRRGGERRRVTMVFSDVRGFTAFSETREPEEVVEMLNEYLQAQAEVVVKHGGDIDKFVGDELMARFTGDSMELRATKCAVEMIAAVNALNEKIGAHNLSVGVGVNAGDVIFGAMGAEHRLDFTVIGDSVNLAARLCSSAKGGEVLVTQVIRDAVGDALEMEPLEPIRVKGKAEPIPIYRAKAK